MLKFWECRDGLSMVPSFQVPSFVQSLAGDRQAQKVIRMCAVRQSAHGTQGAHRGGGPLAAWWHELGGIPREFGA